jgi:hypothetical protein
MKRSNRLVTHRTILALTTLAFTMGAATIGARPASAAHATSARTITATIHDNWDGVRQVPTNLRYEFMQRPHYTLHVTGSNFVPAAHVSLALLRRDTLQVFQRGSTSVQGAYLHVGPGHERNANPRAGTFSYQAPVGLPMHGIPVSLWSRSANRLGIDPVNRT